MILKQLMSSSIRLACIPVYANITIYKEVMSVFRVSCVNVCANLLFIPHTLPSLPQTLLS
jgi:hypothetical protein